MLFYALAARPLDRRHQHEPVGQGHPQSCHEPKMQVGYQNAQKDELNSKIHLFLGLNVLLQNCINSTSILSSLGAYSDQISISYSTSLIVILLPMQKTDEIEAANEARFVCHFHSFL